MTTKPGKIEFVKRMDNLHNSFQNHLTLAEIYPHKENLGQIIEDLNQAKNLINRHIRLNDQKSIQLRIQVEGQTQDYCIKNNEIETWSNIIANKERNLLFLAHIYSTLEQKIVENIQLENIKPYFKDVGIIYLNHVTMFIPLSKSEKCSIREQLQRVDYLMKRSTSTYTIHNEIYDRDEALQFAQNVTQNCFYVLNASEYPLKETAAPLIGEKYKKIKKKSVAENFGLAIH